MNIIGQYTNGNYEVTLYDNGTKVRENDLDNLTPSFPECVDISVSEYCENDCSFCYLGCSRDGEHGKIMNMEFIKSLHPYTEVAFNINSQPHPQLVSWLEALRFHSIIANATVAQSDFMKDPAFYQWMMECGLIHGLGISLTDSADEVFLSIIQAMPNVVIHIIAGLVRPKDLERLADKNLKILILGFKNKGRGEKIWSSQILSNIELLKDILMPLLKRYNVISFDNLALKQLNVQSMLPPPIWESIYMGDDGDYTMYVDLVNQKFGPSSTSAQRWDLLPSIDDMFKQVQTYKGA